MILRSSDSMGVVAGGWETEWKYHLVHTVNVAAIKAL